MKIARLLISICLLILISTGSIIILLSCKTSSIDYLKDQKPNLNFNNEIQNNTSLNQNPKTRSINILILGGDKVANNTDTIILANFNLSTAKLNLLSIPRDTKVNIKGSDVPKINSAYPAGGAKEAVNIVSRLLNVNINNYIFINASTFSKIIDLLDGVDVNIPTELNYDDPVQNLHIHLEKGQQHLDGEKAEEFVRFRKPNSYSEEVMKYYDGSDLNRINSQQELIKELIRQKVNLRYTMRLKDVINTIYENIETNISISEAIKMAVDLSGLKLSNIGMFTLPGDAEDDNRGSYFIPNSIKTRAIVKNNFSSN